VFLPRSTSSSVTGIGQLSDGRIVASVAWAGTFSVVGLLPNGRIDQTFGTAGWTSDYSGEQSEGGGHLRVQPDDKIVVVARTQAGAGQTNVEVIRLNANGSLDTSFGDSGVASTVIGYSTTHSTLALGPDGAIVVVADAYDEIGNSAMLIKISPAGVVDTLFGFGLSDHYNGMIPRSIAIDAYGRIFVAGMLAATDEQPSIGYVARYWP
jgi:uncharacterized delta-60 repeat protein